MTRVRFLFLGLFTLLNLSGCASQESADALGAYWSAQNKKLVQTLGTRYYEIDRLKAHRAMIIALSTLDLIVENQDSAAGYIMARGGAPRPLTAAEWAQVRKVEESKTQEFMGPFAALTGRSTDVIVNAFIIERSKDVQINLRFRTKYTGSTTGIIFSEEAPPLAVKIGLQKVWDEFERIAFVQREIIDK